MSCYFWQPTVALLLFFLLAFGVLVAKIAL